MVQQDSLKTLTKFKYPCPFKVSELHNLVETGKRSELTFLYSISSFLEHSESDLSSDSDSESESESDSLIEKNAEP